MIMILALALILRLILLNQSLWLDEAIEALALMGRQGPLLQYALGDYQPPLYHLLGYLTTHLFGYSEIVLRLPSLISGLFTVYFVIKIGEVIGNKRAGYIAGVLAATNPLLIYYAQEGRTYAMTTFFVTASFYYLIRLLKGRSRTHYILYAIYTTLFLWTSYLAWFVFLAQAGYVLYKKRFDIFALQTVAACTLLAWLPSFIRSLGIGQLTRSGSPEWGKVVGGLSWKSLPLTWVKFVIGRISFTPKWFYGAVVAVLLLLHGWVLRKCAVKKNSLLFFWLLTPIILGIMAATVIPIYQYFRVLFALPAYLLLLALCLAQHKKSYLTAVLVLSQLACLAYFWLSPAYHREDWRSLVQDLRKDATATIAMPSRAQDAPLRYYGITREIVEPAHEKVVGERVYYIRYVEDLFDVGKQGQANLHAAGYTSSSQLTYPGIAVDIYENSH